MPPTYSPQEYAKMDLIYGECRCNFAVNEGRPRFDVEDEVLQAVADEPSTSVRAIEASTGVPKSTAHRILQAEKFHPYHVQRVQGLLPRDYLTRLAFCRRMLRMYREDPQFFNKILWTTLKKRTDT
ncbi:unnamed protein product [Euphydryas editha]|uniref:HTH iclR-type domain-containing protein n=1 Tax=Euphydryas editha TaxID=104508 RepID=A0AAU9U5R1_EUPED|nr:unnamed protein product [Euphydryas editha]